MVTIKKGAKPVFNNGTRSPSLELVFSIVDKITSSTISITENTNASICLLYTSDAADD